MLCYPCKQVIAAPRSNVCRNTADSHSIMILTGIIGKYLAGHEAVKIVMDRYGRFGYRTQRRVELVESVKR